MSSTRESLCMCDLCRKRAAAYARTEAFAAIRRAAVLIRAHERMGSILDEFACFKSEAPKLRAEGQLMRLTVRAAIGSDKA